MGPSSRLYKKFMKLLGGVEVQAFGARAIVVVGLFLSLIVPAASLHAQGVTSPEQPFRFSVADWNRAIENARETLEQPGPIRAETAQLRADMDEVIVDTSEVLETLRSDLEAAQRRQAALGDPPADGEAEEAPTVSAQRSLIAGNISDIRGRIAQTELARLAAREVIESLAQQGRDRLLERIQARGPLPIDPNVLGRAALQGLQVIDQVLQSPIRWFETLPENQRSMRDILAPLVFIPVAFAFALLLRRFLLTRFGRVAEVMEPTYTRRMSAAIVEGVARGLVPASVFAVIFLRVESDALLGTGLFGFMVSTAAQQAIAFLVLAALIRAALAPDMPQWRLTRLEPQNASVLSSRMKALAAIFTISEFLLTVIPEISAAPEIESVTGATTVVLQSIMIVLIARPTLWKRSSAKPVSPEEDEDDDTVPDAGLWAFVRRAFIIIPLLAVLATAVGFVNLGEYLVPTLVQTGLVAAGAYLLRELLRELIGFVFRSIFVRDRLAVPHETRNKAKFWLRAILDPIVLLISALMILPLWGVPWLDVLALIRDVLFGFEVGQVRISLIDILAAATVFIIAIAVTRLLQRTLRDRILPQTRLDVGVRHSVTAGIGYLGAILGGLIAITVVGFDLSNVALIAGALSVGIGFGLQNIVNNFVSGLILLVERPIKVGDWVNVNGNEGFVKQINVRATEIETFQQASVIIPNADLLSTAVTNWTHKNKYGRVEVDIGVAYGTDTRLVERILLEVAQAHPMIVKDPAPYCMFLDFGDSALVFSVRCYTHDVVWKMTIASDIRHEVDRLFKEAEIEIPFPQRVIHMAQPTQEAASSGPKPQAEKRSESPTPAEDPE